MFTLKNPIGKIMAKKSSILSSFCQYQDVIHLRNRPKMKVSQLTGSALSPIPYGQRLEIALT
jgi:hypothetical protein